MNRYVLLCWILVACATGADSDDPPDQARTDGFEPPIVTNAEPAVTYPVALYEQGVEGTVILRLFVDVQGKIVPESTHVAERSGYAAFDSAAVAGVGTMRFAPARRDGLPVATTFLQPVHFRLPDNASSGERR